jgi:hypothetical protein
MPLLTLPIYYTQEFKTKPPRTFLVGLNWYRNVNPYLSNTVKLYYANLIEKQLGSLSTTPKFQYRLNIKLYYSNPSCDGANIFAIIEKFTLDTLQHLNWVKQDNVQYHLGTTTEVVGKDKDNPRVEITLEKVETDE